MKRIVAVIVGFALMAPALAEAQSSCASYNTPALCSVTASRTTSTDASTLPFTGLDVVLLVVGGATLLGAGLIIRTFSRRLD